MLNGGIFLMGDGALLRMTEQAYAAEDVLQRYLADYPDLLAGDQINPEAPRRWLLVSREIGVPGEEQGSGRWSLDHLFLDQDGMPTLVEVKRSSDTRARREVVAQMLDYAANAVVYWPQGFVEAAFRQSWTGAGQGPDAKLDEFLAGESDPDRFWETVDANLRAHRIRLIFLADTIGLELQRIVNFLAQQFRDVETLAIEVKQFTGGGRTAFVPRLVTEPAVVRNAPSTPNRDWDRASFFAEIEALPDGRRQATIAAGLIAWAETKGVSVKISGRSTPTAQLGPPVEFPGLYWCSLWLASTEVRLEVRFNYLRRLPQLADPAHFQEFLRRLGTNPQLQYSPRELESRPGRPLRVLASDEHFQSFTDAFDWLIQRMRTDDSDVSGPTSDIVAGS